MVDRRTGLERKVSHNESMIAGMMGVRTRVKLLDISKRDQETVIAAIDRDIAELRAIIDKLKG